MVEGLEVSETDGVMWPACHARWTVREACHVPGLAWASCPGQGKWTVIWGTRPKMSRISRLPSSTAAAAVKTVALGTVAQATTLQLVFGIRSLLMLARSSRLPLPRVATKAGARVRTWSTSERLENVPTGLVKALVLIPPVWVSAQVTLSQFLWPLPRAVMASWVTTRDGQVVWRQQVD